MIYLETGKPFIAIFASGFSIENLIFEDIELMGEKCFRVFMNYAPSKFKEKHIDALIWSDKKVTGWLDITYNNKFPHYLFLGRTKAFLPHDTAFKRRVDVWWEESAQGIKGNYTLPWTIQLFQNQFPAKPILIFGLDGVGNGKWYDKYTSFDSEKRGKNFPTQQKLDECSKQMIQFCKKENTYNCNMESTFNHFEKKEWRAILGL